MKIFIHKTTLSPAATLTNTTSFAVAGRIAPVHKRGDTIEVEAVFHDGQAPVLLAAGATGVISLKEKGMPTTASVLRATSWTVPQVAGGGYTFKFVAWSKRLDELLQANAHTVTLVAEITWTEDGETKSTPNFEMTIQGDQWRENEQEIEMPEPPEAFPLPADIARRSANLADLDDGAEALVNLGGQPVLDFAGRNVIHVSKGDAATDTRTSLSKYDAVKPFATMVAALAAATSGDIIRVAPGTYSENLTPLTLKSGVDWLFDPGVTVSGPVETLPVWDIGDQQFAVHGASDFILSGNSSVLQPICVRIDNANADVALNAGEINSFDAVGNGFGSGAYAVSLVSGKLRLNADLITAESVTESPSGAVGLQIINGEAYVNAREIYGGWVGVNLLHAGGAESVLYVTADSILSRRNGGAVVDNSTAGGLTAYVKAKLIRNSDTTTDSHGAIVMGYSEMHVDADVIDGGIHIYNGSGSLFCRANVMTTSYVPDAGQGFQSLLLTDSSGSSYVDLDIKQIDPAQSAYDAFVNPITLGGDATFILRNCVYTATATSGPIQITQGAGTIRLINARIDTSADATISPIHFKGATNIKLILDNCVLMSHASQPCISTTDPVTITVYNTRATTAVGAGITQQVGTIVVDTNVK